MPKKCGVNRNTCLNNRNTKNEFEHNRLLDSLVVACWHRVREVPGSIPSQGPRHTKDVIKMVPGSSLVYHSTLKREILSEVIGRCSGHEKNPLNTQKQQKSNAKKTNKKCEHRLPLL